MTREGEPMTVTTTEALRAAADLRRRAADAERHEHGDIGYQRYRSMVPGVGVARRSPRTRLELRAATEVRNGKELVHTAGYFTRYNRPYPMWDSFGEYREKVRIGAGARTLASSPEVAFLTNHGGMAMARTTTGTLELREDAQGGWHDGWLNPIRNDVHDLVIAIEDGDIPQMSFAFVIPDGQGLWSEDFLEFDIAEYDMDGGDVSACNFGANPYTDITARASEMLDDLDRLPRGALLEARSRLDARAVAAPRRDRIEVRHAARQVDPKASPVRQRLQGRVVRTAARFADLANREGLSVEDLASARLPWYEIRAAVKPDFEARQASDEHIPPDDALPDETDVFVFDEIGGSFGVDAKIFAEDLNAITTPRINLRLNSPGGSVFDGMAIGNALRHHPAHVTAYVDGIAASAASVIALGADEIVTMPGGQWMLHDASMTIEGNESELTKGATHLGRQSDNIADMYAKRMGITATEARQMMLDETWAFADESVALGLADRVGGPNPAKKVPADLTERMARSHDLTQWGYRYHGRAAAPAPRITRTGAGRPAETRDLAARTERSTPAEPMGRSIAYIEALLDTDFDR